MINGQAIYPPGESGGLPLLAPKVAITESYKRRLLQAGVLMVYIDDKVSEGIEPDEPVDQQVQSTAINQVAQTFQQLVDDDKPFSIAQAERFQLSVDALIGNIMKRRSLFMSLTTLGGLDTTRVEHAVNICILGTAIAREYFPEQGWRDYLGRRRRDRLNDRIHKLGMGLILHDIGALAIPEEIWSKRGLRTASERALVQSHPTKGAEMARAARMSPLTSVTIAHHHERFDGNGYPDGLSGEQVHDHGQICGLAETYVGMCRNREANQELDPQMAYEMIVRSSGRMFSPEMVQAFQKAIAPYSPGSLVLLSDGSYGIVADMKKGAPLQPKVRITHAPSRTKLDEPEDVDLSVERTLTIKRSVSRLPGDDPANDLQPEAVK